MSGPVMRTTEVAAGGGLTLTAVDSGTSLSDPATTGTVDPTANEHLLLIVTVAVEGGGETHATDQEILPGDANGVTWTYLDHQQYARRAIYLFYGTANDSPSSGTFSLDFSSLTAATFEEMRWSISQITGAAATPLSNTSVNSDTTGTTATVTIGGTVDAGDWIVVGFGVENEVTMTLESGLTQLHGIFTGTAIRSMQTAYDDTPTIDQTPSTSWTGNANWGVIGAILEVE